VIQSYLAKMDGRVDDWNRMQAAILEAPETLDTAVLDDGSPLDD